MCVAMDPTSSARSTRVEHRRPFRAIWLCVASTLVPGCAHVERFQNAEPPPMLGSATPRPGSVEPAPLAMKEPAAAATAEPDDYAAWLERRTPALYGVEVASESEPGATNRSTAHALDPDQDRRPVQVALQPPVVDRTEVDVDRVSLEMRDAGSVSLPPAATSALERSPVDELGQIRQVLDDSQRQLASLDNYQVMMSRQESVKGAVQPAEDVQLSIRRDPKAVRLEWLDGPNKGREVIYNEGGMMHVNMPGSLVPRISLPPDSPIALKNSRHPISEAGFAKIIEQIMLPLQSAERGGADAGRFRYDGLGSPEPGAPPCHAIVRVTPSGETWTVHIDDATKLPYIVHAEDASGALLEHYVFRNPQLNTTQLAAVDAFDHETRWGQSGSLLNRLARGLDDPGSSPATSSPR